MNIVKALRAESTPLHEVIPLKTPFTFNIETNNYCDFRCAYCQQSLPTEKRLKILGTKKHLDLQTFQLAVDGMQHFEEKVKVFNFCGSGETILTPDLPEMVRYAMKSKVVERTNVVTNANSLTYEKSDALIDAGLGSLRISIQGLDAEKYQEVCGVLIDYDKFLDQIKYFYQHRGNCEVHIKIIDIALGNYQEQDFYDRFGQYCSSIAVERFIPMMGISYDKLNLQERDITVHGFKKEDVQVCFSAFYALSLDMEGNIAPCCMPIRAISLGNVKEQSVYEMWHSQRLKQFWELQLTDRRQNTLCKMCNRPSNAVQPGDNIDPYRKELLDRIRNL